MTDAAIDFERLTFGYNGAVALEDVSFSLAQGERVGLLGPNGGGKTTLLKIALGLLGGYRGSVKVFGESPTRARRDGLMGYVAQRCEAELSFPLSVRQVVAMPLHQGARERTSRRQIGAAVDEMLELVGLTELAARAIGRLSGGQLQRALIARALVGRPRLLALDEPTVGVDVAGQQRFATLLDKVHSEYGLTLLVVSHDLRAIAASCDKVACLNRTLHFHDAPSGLTPQVLAEVFRHDVSAAFGEVHVNAHRAEECPLGEGAEARHDHLPDPSQRGESGD